MKKILISFLILSSISLFAEDEVATTSTDSSATSSATSTSSATTNSDLLNQNETTTRVDTQNSVTGKTGEVTSSGEFTKLNEDGKLSEGDMSNNRKKILKYPLTNLIKSTEWSKIMQEFEITMNLGSCGTGNKWALGLAAHMIDFSGYFERVNTPLNFPFVGIKLGKKPIKSGTPFESADANDDVRAQVTNSHYIDLPLLGMIFKKKMSFWCLGKGNISLPYISEFDVTYKKDYMYIKLIPQMLAMFSPDTIISGIFDAAATETAAVLYGNADASEFDLSKFEKYEDKDSQIKESKENGGEDGTLSKLEHGTRDVVNGIRNSIYFIDGCNGFSPVGGYENGNDPIIEAHNNFHGISNLLQTASAISSVDFFKKQSNFSFFQINGQVGSAKIVDTMCQPKSFPSPIPSQFGLQLAYPTIGTTKEVGQDGITTSTAKNVSGAEGIVFVVWQRRDYYAFAYFCPGDKRQP